MSVRLLLDEMFSPTVAEQLRGLGHDVVALVAEPSCVGMSDKRVLEWATAYGRCVVTENVADFHILHTLSLEQGQCHAGLLFTSPRSFPRDRKRIGALVQALDGAVREGMIPPPGQLRWLK